MARVRMCGSAAVLLVAGSLFWFGEVRAAGQDPVEKGKGEAKRPEPPKPAPQVSVRFSADPYAAVTIPGVFANAETPFSKSFPAGDYKVTFRHPSGKTISTRLGAAKGGSFMCTARMNVPDQKKPASASCRSR